jgi:hypothetical protein
LKFALANFFLHFAEGKLSFGEADNHSRVARLSFRPQGEQHLYTKTPRLNFSRGVLSYYLMNTISSQMM